MDYVNAHGTATPQNDSAETAALKAALGERAREIPVSSIKSMIGHCLCASGAIEAVATALTVRDGKVPPTIHYANPDPACDLDYVPNVARDVDVDVALSNSFAFGGNSSVVVLVALRRSDDLMLLGLGLVTGTGAVSPARPQRRPSSSRASAPGESAIRPFRPEERGRTCRPRTPHATTASRRSPRFPR